MPAFTKWGLVYHAIDLCSAMYITYTCNFFLMSQWNSIDWIYSLEKTILLNHCDEFCGQRYDWLMDLAVKAIVNIISKLVPCVLCSYLSLRMMNWSKRNHERSTCSNLSLMPWTLWSISWTMLPTSCTLSCVSCTLSSTFWTMFPTSCMSSQMSCTLSSIFELGCQYLAHHWGHHLPSPWHPSLYHRRQSPWHQHHVTLSNSTDAICASSCVNLSNLCRLSSTSVIPANFLKYFTNPTCQSSQE